MNVSEYIASGILENYIRGEVSDQERREVECLSKIYPEIREEMDALEVQLETYSREYAVKAPDGLRSSILTAIKEIEPDAPSDDQPKTQMVDEKSGESPVVISMQRNRWNPMIAASIILLLGINIVLFFQFRKIEQEREALIAQFEELSEAYQIQIAESDKSEELLEFVKQNGTQLVAMNCVLEEKEFEVPVFWNDASGEILVNVNELPKLGSEEQYQLWVLVDGKPIDMGLIDNSLIEWQKMKKTERADAFAITVEKAGGSPTPTLEKMIVYGEV